MKLFLAPLLLLLLPAVFGQTALEERWAVTDPTLAYDENTGVFTMSLGTGWGVYRLGIESFDICPNGDPEYNGAEPLDENFQYFFVNTPTFVNDLGVNHIDNGAGSFPRWTHDWSFTMDSSVANSVVYSEANGVGTVQFCTRAGLMDRSTYWYYPNFRQIQVTITYDLNVEGFPVSTFSTQVIEEVTGNVNDIQLLASATTCDGTTGPYNQGEEICLNVCADGTLGLGADVDSISQLVMEIDGQPNIAQQVLIFQGNPYGNAISVDCATDACCQVRFLLENSFFPVGPSDIPPVATVIGEGDCTISLNGQRRKLRIVPDTEGRALQETVDSKFEGQFEIQQPDHTQEVSSASTMITAAGLAGAAGAALLL